MSFNFYQSILSFIVFALLTALFTTFVALLVKYYVKLVRAGINDEKITNEYIKQKNKKHTFLINLIDKVVLILSCAVLFVAFIFSISVSFNDGKVCGSLPSMSVVKSGSMSSINSKNKYFNDRSVGGQMQIFDLVFLHKLPDEFDIQLYDVVVYENDGLLIIHRIVGIEEPNERHPDSRYFLLHGDANAAPDVFPVEYSQMKAIYRGERIPFVGSFIIFMQSPAGYLCILLVLFAIIATPIAEKKINKEKYNRLVLIGVIKDDSPTAISQDCALSEQPSSAALSENLVDNANLGTEQSLDQINQFVLAEKDEQKSLSVKESKNSKRFNFKSKSFAQKITFSVKVLRQRYTAIHQQLINVKGVRVIRSKKWQTYRKGLNGICRLAVRGKTLNVYLALNPDDYKNFNYPYVDVSASKKHANYPMLVKITSTRQLNWCVKLIGNAVSLCSRPNERGQK